LTLQTKMQSWERTPVTRVLEALALGAGRGLWLKKMRLAAANHTEAALRPKEHRIEPAMRTYGRRHGGQCRKSSRAREEEEAKHSGRSGCSPGM
jgi:hypothetical protein